jgi:hypothetical protein
LTRDEILVEAIQSVLLDGKVLTRPLVPPKGHWISRFTIAARILLILAGALYIYGFSQLPTPADAIPPSSRSSSLRLAASLIVFLIMLLNVRAGQWRWLQGILQGLMPVVSGVRLEQLMLFA